MQNPDNDEEFYKAKSKVLYRRSSASHQDLLREPSSSRTDSEDRHLEEPFQAHGYSGNQRSSRRFSDRRQTGRRSSWSEMSRATEPVRYEMVLKRSPSKRRPTDPAGYKMLLQRTSSPDIAEFSGDETSFSEREGTVKIRKVKKVWSYKTVRERTDDQSSYGRSADQSSYGERDDISTKTTTVKTEDTGYKSNLSPAEQNAYSPVAKWDVDYTNRNYMRSKCNKPAGLHRHTLGKQFQWDVDYDNAQYLRSQVNAPKGLHRRTKDVKRKRVPDNDVLADSTGWEFGYGPEFLQAEEDVPYMPDEQIVGRGAYRSYGVTRSQSDTDVKDEERRRKIHGLVEDEFKYGPEFLQDDVQHTLEQKDGFIGRGAYRFYEADRSPCDKKPCDMMGIDYRESRAIIDDLDDEDADEEKGDSMGKPFKRTVLKKVVKLSHRASDENMFGTPLRYQYGTGLSFVPGAGSRSDYEGISIKVGDRDDLKVKKHPSIRSTFSKTLKTCSFSKCGQCEEDFHCEKKYNHKHYWDEHQSGRNTSDYSVSKALYPRRSPDQKYGTSDHCDLCEREDFSRKGSPETSYRTSDRCNLCDRKEIPGMTRITPERSYERQIPKREKRPAARSVTSYESCEICDRKEVPGMIKKTLPGTDSGYKRGMAYSSRDYSEKKQTSPRYQSYDRLESETETYEKRRNTSPRGYRPPESEKIRKWKELERQESRPLRMTGSITQRHHKNPRRELKATDHYQRFHNQYAFPVEMMDENDVNFDGEDEEETLEEIPSYIEKRISKIKKEVSEIPCEKASFRQVGSSRRATKVPKDTERVSRHQDEYVYGGEVMDEDRNLSSEEFIPHVESTSKVAKKKLSKTYFPAGKRKVSPKRVDRSDSLDEPSTDGRKESKIKNYSKKNGPKESYSRGMKTSPKQINESDLFDDHSMDRRKESKIKDFTEKNSIRESYSRGLKTFPKRINEFLPFDHSMDDRRESKIKDYSKKNGVKESYSRGMKENEKRFEKLPPHSGSRNLAQKKKKSPPKLLDIKERHLKDYNVEESGELSDPDGIDFEAHQYHPKDQGQSFKDGYEKYVNENGSEIWIKTEERYSELHHVP